MTGSIAKSSPEAPWPVRTLNTKIGDWVHRLGEVWVEGQITQISRRPGTKTAFLQLRDPAADISITVTCGPQVLDRSEVPLTEGIRVVMAGRPSFYTGRATISLRVTEIRPIGIGELLARLERLRRLLAAEGMFDAALKRRLPFLPGGVGLITGRASAAERDVVSVATARWPAVRMVVRNTPVQGPTAVPAILEALAELDADPAVSVIIIARGGGSVEDLLPFSDETLCRAVSRMSTPVVSAIGHEPDHPILDLVADLRAATPTDAAKKVVPDVPAELALLAELRSRSAGALRNWVGRERHGLAALRGRSVLADPHRMIDAFAAAVQRDRHELRREIARYVGHEEQRVENLASRLATLGPAQTLARGYAVVQRVYGDEPPVVVTSTKEMPIGSELRVRVADGAMRAAVMGTDKKAGETGL
ncbi:exodeoxyribonuclease VII large subunit [Williamsia sp. CHRR-6]|uniref:exodeoxyribonuclease VII large subunit n=1 Tax=Williamsia sp. CHRR-6 TaxID=2835871 RepID=UPI001BDAE10D|nr:exodeoxyribonuclease VII large subunit [Williamsia sp. CHRR-6]MBT0566735.1 exodeoxyribonuclease VII large subunit [Williamsia sp. CHRR-6]